MIPKGKVKLKREKCPKGNLARNQNGKNSQREFKPKTGKSAKREFSLKFKTGKSGTQRAQKQKREFNSR